MTAKMSHTISRRLTASNEMQEKRVLPENPRVIDEICIMQYRRSQNVLVAKMRDR